MRTTLNIEDALYRRAKIKAAQEQRTVTDLVEQGLRLALEATTKVGREPLRAPLPLIAGGHPAAADEEMTPEKTAEILIAQDASWERGSE